MMSFALARGRVLPAVVVVLSLVGSLHAESLKPVRFRSGPLPAAAQTADERAAVIERAADDGRDRHVMMQFDGPLTREDRARLAELGLTPTTYLNDHAYVVRLDAGRLRSADAARFARLVRVMEIDPRWKLHPMLAEGRIPEWAIVSHPESGQPATVAVVGAYVLFHENVALAPDAAALVARHGAIVRAELRSVNGLVIELPFDRIAGMASEEDVLWIEPPLPKLEPVNDSNRELTGANIVQDAPYNLDGSGVRVLVFDAGVMASNHPDLEGRIINPPDTSGVLDHATHVGGTVGGTGELSGGQFRGMAPGVEFVSLGFEWTGDLFLYSNPGDVETDYETAITEWDSDISNNSIGTNTCWNGFPCEITGDYGVTDGIIDKIVGGFFGEPFRVVWANGNERSCPFCPGVHQNGYHSTAPPACAKNHCTVGALNSNDDSMSDFSSWGPCDDGRMKPDVSAPGCQSDGDLGVTSCSAFGGYESLCGTSMASPTVCGIGALMLEDFRAHYPDRPDFRNSMLRAMLAHNADDWGASFGFPGPDYRTGYGSVRVQPTIDFIRSGNFSEQEIDQDGTYSALVIVSEGDPEMKVTVAWDDPFSAPLVETALVNDLDLVVFDPSGNQRFPWTLNPADPIAPAVQSQPDRVNNIEQVYVAAPEPGVWRVEVHGFNVAQGPQPFSLCGSPYLVNCSTRGVVSLDRARYACEGNAVIQVVDCDLNTDDNVAESIQVNVASSLEPAGETITVTESGGATALFRGNLPVSATDAEGVLHIDHDAVVTAKYIDADDGFGGTNVLMEDGAVVDCVAPAVLGVAFGDIAPYAATVTVTTDELARPTVRFGLACGDWLGTVSAEDFGLATGLPLSGLLENTAYFVAVEVVDSVGNVRFDDAGGACYPFVTADIPNFFTREFEGPSEVEGFTLDFTPEDSVDRYVGCLTAISSLPTDPTGATVLTLSNDDTEAVTLADGRTVSLYGTEYSTFFVGSNGYITFEGGDVDGTESAADHFGQPRISALFDNLNPAGGGTVSWMQLANRAVVTWENVPEAPQIGSNTFQVELYFDGRVTISYLTISATDGIAGLSDGGGLSPYFQPTDFTTFVACGPRPPRTIRVDARTVVDEAVAILLEATDDGLPDPPGALSYRIAELPLRGQLSDPNGGAIDAVPYELLGGGNAVVYTPDGGLSGPDSFRFTASDGGAPPEGGESAPASVLLRVDLDCNANHIGDPFDLDSGTSQDCNLNLVPDECDIAGGLSGDCEPDGIPDECQTDCNLNGTTDACDIAGGASNDCNSNATPDECDLAGWANNYFEFVINPPAAIPQAGFITQTFTMPSSATVVDVNLRIDVNHDRIGDMRIALRHGGREATVVDRCGGDGDDFANTLFDDQAITPICDGEPPFFGAYRPHQSLSVFDGMDMQGEWTLYLRDTAPGVSGSLVGWTLHLPVGSPDCNANAVPDECEPDCNDNDEPDSCDIANGQSADKNGDGVPDECQCAAPGDLDGDGSIDLADVAGLQNCFGGAAVGACACADISGDGVVNAGDIVGFVNLLAGP